MSMDREDEALDVLEGSVTIQVGDEPAVEARPGDLALAPRDCPGP